ncbi:uncharacterized protein STEHIDRAFT_116297 [Stereum hirsutum FP-91666 SS1]|uniref:Uncharacterized protein n=1 Tax=Stereum hirsutum (strain FP-91666) TaxID=721885 RepID=R7RWW6_STEHR|nr:uncharacterized protein STEHIDRAFT_116297 [Stereum hirsutum FP-91666 SS1]EIM79824.1 hypothetical protein STEHIDRAFT_116297 [Stereum hirsutum FP-91666 SS1]
MHSRAGLAYSWSSIIEWAKKNIVDNHLSENPSSYEFEIVMSRWWKNNWKGSDKACWTTFCGIGWARVSKGNKAEESLGTYCEAPSLRPTCTRAIYNVGVAYLNIGAHKEAVEHF